MANAHTPEQTVLRALIIHPDDNVANVIGSGRRGQSVSCRVEGQASDETIELMGDLPSNHKIARRDIAANEPILKYGLRIGTASHAIKRGEHVHAHNIESDRGRGDLQPA